MRKTPTKMMMMMMMMMMMTGGTPILGNYQVCPRNLWDRSPKSCVKLPVSDDTMIWIFLEMRVPLVIFQLSGIFPCKPSSYREVPPWRAGPHMDPIFRGITHQVRRQAFWTGATNLSLLPACILTFQAMSSWYEDLMILSSYPHDRFKHWPCIISVCI